MIKSWMQRLLPNALDKELKKRKILKSPRVLIVWNRGLGDIALGLYALVHRIRTFLPQAEITFLTRENLKEGFALLSQINVIVCPEWKRGNPIDLKQTFSSLNLCFEDYDLILEKPDPSRWLCWQLGSLTPKLVWDQEWDSLWTSFSLEPNRKYVAVHVQTETQYGYEKNWPVQFWSELFDILYYKKQMKAILFGFQPTFTFNETTVVDLRGKTSLFEMLSLIKNRCDYLIAPDSGVLSLVYYLNVSFPLHVISLWADPHQGILKQNVTSPNPQLIHCPLFGKKEDISTITVTDVLKAF